MLRGGEINEPKHAFIHDLPPRPAADVYRLPPDPLRLAPDGLENYDPRFVGDRPPRLDDALAQLAQARSASPTTALTDLWTAVEALFAGTGADSGYEAGNVMAALAEFQYPRSMFDWLGLEMRAAAYGSPPIGAERKFVQDALVTDSKAVVAAFVSAGRPLAWRRVQGVMRWDVRDGYRLEAAALRARMECVCHRAYLIRNSLIHVASLGMSTLNVTLPAFADLTRVCIGHVLNFADGDGALAEARRAVQECRWVMERWEAGTISAEEGLRRLVHSP
jgi:hypothetical protein